VGDDLLLIYLFHFIDVVESSWNRRGFVSFLRLFDSLSKPPMQNANHKA
jgi:hypothetical protein